MSSFMVGFKQDIWDLHRFSQLSGCMRLKVGSCDQGSDGAWARKIVESSLSAAWRIAPGRFLPFGQSIQKPEQEGAPLVKQLEALRWLLPPAYNNPRGWYSSCNCSTPWLRILCEGFQK